MGISFNRAQSKELTNGKLDDVKIHTYLIAGEALKEMFLEADGLGVGTSSRNKHKNYLETITFV